MNLNSAHIEIAGESNVGTTRNHNEDNFLVFAPHRSCAAIAVIADGIGGHSRGEIASYICCHTFLCEARKTPSEKWDRDFLKNTLATANKRMFEFNFSGKRPRPMGCTVAAMIFFRDKVIAASAGDSRIYEYDPDAGENGFRQITTDHRPEKYDELACLERFRHISFVSRSMGTAKTLDADIFELPRAPRTKYLLCSDGLYNRQSDDVLKDILASSPDSETASSRLLRGALISGERDNVSVICAAPPQK